MKNLIVLTEADFLRLNEELLKMGYIKITAEDSKKNFKRLGMSPPHSRKIVGRETGYQYFNNGYVSKVWTSYLEKEKKWRDSGTDAGRCLIAKGDTGEYFARSFQRTEGFVLKILRYAWVTKWKVDHRPLCPHCNAYMDIDRKKYSRAYRWVCKRTKKHPDEKYKYLNWDYGLPPKAKAFVEIRRKNTRKYKKKLQKEGKEVIPAPVKRKKWEIKKPENLI